MCVCVCVIGRQHTLQKVSMTEADGCCPFCSLLPTQYVPELHMNITKSLSRHSLGAKLRGTQVVTALTSFSTFLNIPCSVNYVMIQLSDSWY